MLHSLIAHNNFTANYAWHLEEFHDFMRIISRFEEAANPEFSASDMYKNILNDMVYGSKFTNKIDALFGSKLINQVVVEKVRIFLNFILEN